MGDFAKPSVQQVDTTNPALQGFLQNPQGAIQSFGGGNPLATQAGAWMGQNTGGMQSPENDVFQQALPMLMAQMAGGGVNRPEMSFQNQFSEMQNPYGDVGAMNPAFGALAAATPIFDRNLQSANAKLTATAPGRFSSALAQEGRDLGSQAMQDFNLFSQQALSQGIGQQLQQQQANQNFMLGARGLQQGAQAETNQSNLAGRGLAQQGDQANQAGMANIMSVLGNLASNAGNGAFNRNLQAGQFGLAQQASQINPILQLLGLATPQDSIVGQSPMGNMMNLGSLAMQAFQTFKPQNPGSFGGSGQLPQGPGGQAPPGMPRY